MSAPLRLGISPCPNDTFAYHALLADRVDRRGLELELELADVEELNRGLAAGRWDAAKISAAAALELAGETWALPVGWALGRGVGPLLLAAPGRAGARPGRVLAPGAHTTAALLHRLFRPEDGEPEHVVFADILPALRRGEADRGVCIHEARFTWRAHGLERVEDLGETWERATGLPLPLGGVVARRAVGRERARRLAAVLADSLRWGLAHRDETLSTMRAHAQELDDAVLWQHVDLYVGEATLDLGAEGRRALAELARRAREGGLLAAGTELEVLEPAP